MLKIVINFKDKLFPQHILLKRTVERENSGYRCSPVWLIRITAFLCGLINQLVINQLYLVIIKSDATVSPKKYVRKKTIF